MKTTVEKLEDNKIKLEIEVEAEEFDKAMQKAYLKNRSSVTIPGFRKGKAPRKIIEQNYGEGIFYEDAINDIYPNAYDRAVEENELNPVDFPNIDIVQIGEGKNFIFTAEVVVKPDAVIEDYKGIEIDKIQHDVTDEDIEARIEEAREQNARWVSVEDRAVMGGDRLTLDYKGYADGEAFEGGTAENQTLEIGSNSFIPGFEEQLIGFNIGDEEDINITFPEEYHSEELKGKEAVFTVKIHEIKEKEIPNLDDEFIKDISEFDTIEEYSQDLRKTMEESAKQREKTEMENQLLGKVLEKTQVEIPEAMVKTQVDSIVRDMDYRLMQQGMQLQQYLDMINTTMEDFRAQFQAEAHDRVKLQLALEKIIELEQIEATDEELEEEYKKIAEQYKLEVEKVKKDYEGQEADLKNMLATQKAVAFLLDNAVVVEKQEESEELIESEESEKTEETEEV